MGGGGGGGGGGGRAEALKEYVSPKIYPGNCLGCLLGSAGHAVFLAFLLKSVNRAFTDGKEKLSYYDIEICLKTLFWLHFYRCSPAAFFDKKVRKAYGPASDLSEELYEGYFL